MVALRENVRSTNQKIDHFTAGLPSPGKKTNQHLAPFASITDEHVLRLPSEGLHFHNSERQVNCRYGLRTAQINAVLQCHISSTQNGSEWYTFRYTTAFAEKIPSPMKIRIECPSFTDWLRLEIVDLTGR